MSDDDGAGGDEDEDDILPPLVEDERHKPHPLATPRGTSFVNDYWGD